MQIGKLALFGHVVDVGVSVYGQQHLVGSCVQQSLDLPGVVDAPWARQGLVTNDENRALEGFELFREPFELFLANVLGITTLVVLRLLVAIEND